jgi:Kef-type K+ transport system membrane component KefB
VFLAEAAIVLIAAKLGGELASRLDQPPVLGQLLAGLALGGGLSFFDSSPLQAAQKELGNLSQLGVILLMFLAGLETDWDQLRATGRAAFVSASLGVAAPLAAGFCLALLFGLPPIEALFVGVILTATSVSITAQTLMEMGSLQTVEGATVLGAAVIDDVIGLVVFSICVAVTGGNNDTSLFQLGAYLVVFFLASASVMPWVIPRVLRILDRFRGAHAGLTIAIAIGLLYGVAAERAGLAAITGAYVAGLLINRRDERTEITSGTQVLAYGLFIPIFLVKTGMDAHLDALLPAFGFIVATTVIAILSKVVGCGLGARACGLSPRQSLIVGIGMISRGEVALVVATLALASGAISQAVFGATVLVVVTTTLVTPPLLRLALTKRGVESGPELQIAAGNPADARSHQPAQAWDAHSES